MIVTLIEKVYSFLWGDLIRITSSGREQSGDFTSDPSVDPDRNLFYGPDEMSACQTLSGYAESTGREEGKG